MAILILLILVFLGFTVMKHGFGGLLKLIGALALGGIFIVGAFAL